MHFLWFGAVAYAASVVVTPDDAADLGTITASLQAGDIVSFTTGTYELGGTIYWTGAGAENSYIEFRPAPDAGEVILQNNGGGYVASIDNSSYVYLHDLILQGGPEYEYNQPAGLNIYESTNVRIENVVVRDLWGTGIRIDGNSEAITVRRAEIHTLGDGTGIYVGCGGCFTDARLELNLIHDVGGAGIYLSPGTGATQILDNVIFRTDDEGISLRATESEPQNLVQGNAIWQTGWVGVYIEGSALVQNNIIFETGASGIETNNGYGENSLYDVQISHNTIARTEGWGAELDDWYESTDMVFANNAIANPTGYGLYWEDLLYDPYGYGYGTATGPETTNYISSNVVTGLIDGFDPIVRTGLVVQGGGVLDFVDIDSFDFYPSTNSILLSAGDTDGRAYIPAVDFNGTARDGNNPTVGAYEHVGATNTGWVIQENFKGAGVGRAVTDGGAGGCCGGNKGTGTGTSALVFLPLVGLGWLGRRLRS